MNYFSALAAVLGIASGVISIYEFIKKGSWRPGIAFSIAAVVLLVAAGVVANLPSPSRGQASGVSSTPNSSTSQSGTVSTPVQVAPTQPPQPTSIPTPLPTPEPRLYKADWSNGMDGWTESGGWSNVNGMLVNDGSQYSLSGDPTVIAPYPPQDIANYSVQADIRLDRYTDEGGFSGEASFGIVVRSPDGGGGYKIGVCVSAGIYSCGTSDHEIIFSDGSFYQDTPVKQSPFRPAYATWHTYRIDVLGNTIIVWIDGGMVFQLTDDKFLSAGRVGLWSDRSQISVRSFTITAL